MPRRLPDVVAMLRSLTASRVSTLLLWIAWAWVVMTVTHELGHVIGGLIGGAKLAALELRPWHLPYSVLAPDPHPLLSLWSGPVLGCAIPIAVACTCHRPAVWFAAWFCLVANSSYLLLGFLSADAQLDTARLLKAGTPPAVIFVAGGVLLAIGYAGFRRSCADLLSGESTAQNSTSNRIVAISLLAVLALQSVLGGLFVR
jgi:hypothetical protein